MPELFAFGVRGLRELEGIINRLPDRVRAVARQAVRDELEVEFRETQHLVPVDTGALKRSGRIEGPEDDRGITTAAIVYGNESVDYATIVHEDLEAFHPHGQAKFVEQPILQAAPHLGQRVARRIEAELSRVHG